MPKSIYFPQNIFSNNISSVYSPYCLRFSMPPGEGAAKIGTSLSIRNGIFSVFQTNILEDIRESQRSLYYMSMVKRNGCFVNEEILNCSNITVCTEMQPQKRKTHFYCVPFSTGAKHFIAVVRELRQQRSRKSFYPSWL